VSRVLLLKLTRIFKILVFVVVGLAVLLGYGLVCTFRQMIDRPEAELPQVRVIYLFGPLVNVRYLLFTCPASPRIQAVRKIWPSKIPTSTNRVWWAGSLYQERSLNALFHNGC
jgi:hypothetical protein